jgi:hypothetical protein
MEELVTYVERNPRPELRENWKEPAVFEYVDLR